MPKYDPSLCVGEPTAGAFGPVQQQGSYSIDYDNISAESAAVQG
jgi:hypothetical protein